MSDSDDDLNGLEGLPAKRQRTFVFKNLAQRVSEVSVHRKCLTNESRMLLYDIIHKIY